MSTLPLREVSSQYLYPIALFLTYFLLIEVVFNKAVSQNFNNFAPPKYPKSERDRL